MNCGGKDGRADWRSASGSDSATVTAMPTAIQLNLSLSNEIGTLARLCRDLAHGGVNLLALSAPETGREIGVVRLLVPTSELASHVLSKAGYTFSAEEVLFVELKNRPGALAKAVEKLARANIGVRYAYATASPRTRTTAAVVAVAPADLPRALRLLG
jgi:hypothetical protein